MRQNKWFDKCWPYKKNQQIDPKHTVRDYDKDLHSSKFDVKKVLYERIKKKYFKNQNLQSCEVEKDMEKLIQLENNNNNSELQLQEEQIYLEQLQKDKFLKKSSVFYFHGKRYVYCKQSCYMFKDSNKIRQFCVWFTESQFFKIQTSFFILFMSIFQGLNDYSGQSTIWYKSLLDYLKYLFIVYYYLEMILLVIARGLYADKGSYLRDPTNFLSFLILCLIFIIQDESIVYLFVIRLFTVFSAFTKFFPVFNYCEKILTLLRKSISEILQTLLLLIFFLTLFGILGVNLWAESLGNRCRLTEYPENGIWKMNYYEPRYCDTKKQGFQCQKGEFCGSNEEFIDEIKGNSDIYFEIPQLNYGLTNFNNILQSYVTLYTIFLVEDWPQIMYNIYDATGSFFVYVYFLFVLLICTYFLFNLLIAIELKNWLQLNNINHPKDSIIQVLKYNNDLLATQGQEYQSNQIYPIDNVESTILKQQENQYKQSFNQSQVSRDSILMQNRSQIMSAFSKQRFSEASMFDSISKNVKNILQNKVTKSKYALEKKNSIFINQNFDKYSPIQQNQHLQDNRQNLNLQQIEQIEEKNEEIEKSNYTNQQKTYNAIDKLQQNLLNSKVLSNSEQVINRQEKPEIILSNEDLLSIRDSKKQSQVELIKNYNINQQSEFLNQQDIRQDSKNLYQLIKSQKKQKKKMSQIKPFEDNDTKSEYQDSNPNKKSQKNAENIDFIRVPQNNIKNGQLKLSQSNQNQTVNRLEPFKGDEQFLNRNNIKFNTTMLSSQQILSKIKKNIHEKIYQDQRKTFQQQKDMIVKRRSILNQIRQKSIEETQLFNSRKKSQIEIKPEIKNHQNDSQNKKKESKKNLDSQDENSQKNKNSQLSSQSSEEDYFDNEEDLFEQISQAESNQMGLSRKVSLIQKNELMKIYYTNNPNVQRKNSLSIKLKNMQQSKKNQQKNMINSSSGQKNISLNENKNNNDQDDKNQQSLPQQQIIKTNQKNSQISLSSRKSTLTLQKQKFFDYINLMKNDNFKLKGANKKKMEFKNKNWIIKSRNLVKDYLLIELQFLSIKKSFLKSKFFKKFNLLSNYLLNKFWFKCLMNLIIISNLVLLSFNQYPKINDDLEKKLQIANKIFLVIFLLEDYLNLFLIQKGQFEKNLIIILEFLFDLGLTIYQIYFWDGFSIGTSLKGFRLLWIFKQNQQSTWSNYQIMLHTLQQSIKTLLNLAMILGVFIFIGAVIGEWLFYDKLKVDSALHVYGYDHNLGISNYPIHDEDNYYFIRSNFKSIQNAFVTVFHVVQGDTWNMVWFITASEGNQLQTHFYYIALTLIGKIFLGTFVAIMLGNFEEATILADSSKERAKAIIDTFQKQQILNKMQIELIEKGKKTQNSLKLNDLQQSQKSNQEFKLSVSQKLKKLWFRLINHIKNSSLCIFSHNSKIRIKCFKIIQHKWFENGILVIILASSLTLALDDPIGDPDGIFKKIIGYLDVSFTGLFSIELILKAIALGFLYNSNNPKNLDSLPKAYIRNSWNLLDIIVVLSSIIDISGLTNMKGLNALKSLRSLRALRPLKMIAKSDNLKLLVDAIFATIPLVGTQFFVSGIVIWIFSILLMSMQKGQMHFCMISTDLLDQVQNQQMCENLGGEWVNYIWHFDNILNSSLNVFKIIVGENWVQTMWVSVDSVGIDQQPIKNHQFAKVLIFMVLVFICNIFLTNLFIGLVINNFRRLKSQNNGYLFLNDQVKEWVDLQKILIRKKLKIIMPEPERGFRKICYYISMHPYFDRIVILLIFCNVAIMAAIHNGISKSGRDIISTSNDIFLILFHIEALIKISAFGFLYFKESWNKFDFFILVITDIIYVSGQFIDIAQINNLPIIVRALRLGRVVKYIRASKSLSILIDTIYYLLPSLINIGALVFLMVFIGAILGMSLFSKVNIDKPQQVYPYTEIVHIEQISTFQSFTSSLMIIWQTATGQYWDQYMQQFAEQKEGCEQDQDYDDIKENGVQGCGTWVSYLFFVCMVIFLKLIMVNLFLALVIEGFLETLKENESLLTPKQIEILIEKWSEYDPDGSGFLDPYDLAFIIYDLPAPLGMKDEHINNNNNSDQLRQPQDNQKHRYIQHPLKKFYLKKTFILKIFKEYQLRVYQNKKMHFKDLCINISYKAVILNAEQKKQKVNGLFLTVEQEKIIEKSWLNQYPEIKKYLKKQDNHTSMNKSVYIMENQIDKNSAPVFYGKDFIAADLIESNFLTILQKRNHKDNINEANYIKAKSQETFKKQSQFNSKRNNTINKNGIKGLKKSPLNKNQTFKKQKTKLNFATLVPQNGINKQKQLTKFIIRPTNVVDTQQDDEKNIDIDININQNDSQLQKNKLNLSNNNIEIIEKFVPKIHQGKHIVIKKDLLEKDQFKISEDELNLGGYGKNVQFDNVYIKNEQQQESQKSINELNSEMNISSFAGQKFNILGPMDQSRPFKFMQVSHNKKNTNYNLQKQNSEIQEQFPFSDEDEDIEDKKEYKNIENEKENEDCKNQNEQEEEGPKIYLRRQSKVQGAGNIISLIGYLQKNQKHRISKSIFSSNQNQNGEKREGQISSLDKLKFALNRERNKQIDQVKEINQKIFQEQQQILNQNSIPSKFDSIQSNQIEQSDTIIEQFKTQNKSKKIQFQGESSSKSQKQVLKKENQKEIFKKLLIKQLNIFNLKSENKEKIKDGQVYKSTLNQQLENDDQGQDLDENNKQFNMLGESDINQIQMEKSSYQNEQINNQNDNYMVNINYQNSYNFQNTSKDSKIQNLLQNQDVQDKNMQLIENHKENDDILSQNMLNKTPNFNRNILEENYNQDNNSAKLLNMSLQDKKSYQSLNFETISENSKENSLNEDDFKNQYNKKATKK